MFHVIVVCVVATLLLSSNLVTTMATKGYESTSEVEAESRSLDIEECLSCFRKVKSLEEKQKTLEMEIARLRGAIDHLMGVTSSYKEQLEEEITSGIYHLQRQEEYIPEDNQTQELQDSPSIPSLSFMIAASQSSSIPIKEEEENVKVDERPSSVSEGDLSNGTTFRYGSSFSRYQERKLVDVTSIDWSLVTSSARWSGRYSHSSVALDSNTIVLMGGSTSSGSK